MSDATAAWPDPSRLGWPPVGTEHGSAHVLHDGKTELLALWNTLEDQWVLPLVSWAPWSVNEMGWRYLGHALTLAEHAAAIAEARRAALEEAAWVVDVAQKTATARRMNAAERHDWGEHYRASIRQDTYEDVAAAIRALAGEPGNGEA